MWAQLSVALARDEHGEPQYFISMIEDITAQRAATTALDYRASHDQLTGLPNRTLLLERADAALQRAEWHRGHVALLFCDLDEFKLINDSRGHAAGDAVLVETALRLEQCIRDADTAARLGGDEFVVLCEGLSGRTEAENVAQRLIDALTEPMARAGGITMTRQHRGGLRRARRVTAAELLRNADAAMYLAKTGGRDRYALFTPDLVEQATERLDLEHQLREAMRTGRSSWTTSRCGASRTARSCRTRAWSAGSTRPRGAARRRAPSCPSPRQRPGPRARPLRAPAAPARPPSRWGDRPDAPSVSVNVSARHVGRGRLPGLVTRALTDTGLAPQRLVLELTETALLGMTPTAPGRAGHAGAPRRAAGDRRLRRRLLLAQAPGRRARRAS